MYIFFLIYCCILGNMLPASPGITQLFSTLLHCSVLHMCFLEPTNQVEGLVMWRNRIGLCRCSLLPGIDSVCSSLFFKLVRGPRVVA